MRRLLTLLSRWIAGTGPYAADSVRRARARRDWAGALDRARQGASEFPDEAAVPYWEGRTLLDLGEHVAAAGAFERAAAIAPDTARHLGGLGAALHEAGDPEAAVEVLDVALARRPGDPRLWHNRGLSQVAVADTAGAIGSFRRSVMLEPKNLTARSLLGYCLAMQGRPEDAVAAYEEVVRRDPYHPRGWYNLGACLYMAERRPEARRAFRKALAQDPSDRRAASALRKLSQSR